MADMGVVETDDKQAKFRQREPQWHLPPEHAALAVDIASVALDDLRRPLPVTTSAILTPSGLRAMQEAQQRRVRLLLRHAVQIEARVDRLATARDALLEPPVERRQRRRRCRRRLTRRHGMASGLR